MDEDTVTAGYIFEPSACALASNIVPKPCRKNRSTIKSISLYLDSRV